jgi:hypothetical protein
VTRATGREHVWGVTLDVASRLEARGYLRAFTTDTVVDALDDHDVDVSTRTVRRALHAMTELGVLDADDSDPTRYRLANPDALDPDAPETPDCAADTPVDPTPAPAPAGPDLDDLADVAGVTDSDRPLIYHLYADWGVESEPLSAYGDVVRVGLDPDDSPHSLTLAGDARDPPLAPGADLAVLQQPCQRWSKPTRIDGEPEDHPDLLDDARRVGRELADDYILENVPEAPLDDPVVLDGRMFGLPVPFPRAFETSFPVDEPARNADLVDYTGPFATDDGRLGCFRGPAADWRAVKQVSGDYPARALKRSSVPAPYVHHLLYQWRRSRDDLGGENA